MKSLAFKMGDDTLLWECQYDVINTTTRAGEVRPVDVEQALNSPIESPRLEELAVGSRKVVVLVPDITRAWQGIDRMCVAVRKRLSTAGVGEVTWLIATGQHRRMSSDEERAVLGEARKPQDHVLCHQSTENLTDTGKVTSRGTPIVIQKDAYEADLLILLGGVCYHDLAGFAGGRKIIIPGISSRESIQANHRNGLIGNEFNEKVTCGELDKNPVALDMEEYAKVVLKDKKSFLLNVITDERGKPHSYVAGDFLEAWRKGVREAQVLQTIWVDELADVAFVSCGGYPYDLELYQATKALTAVYHGIKEGGGIILVAELREGMGTPIFDRFMRLAMGDLAVAIEELKKDFTIPAYIATKTVYELQGRRCALVTKNKNVAFPGLITDNIEEAANYVLGEAFAGRALYIPTGNAVHVEKVKREV